MANGDELRFGWGHTQRSAREGSPQVGRDRPTILQIIPNLDTGGAELSTLEIVSALAAAGARALVATEGGRLEAEVAARGGELLRFPAATKSPLRMLQNAAALGRIIRDEGIGLVHARSRAPAWSGLFAARRAGVPFVTTYHGAYAERGAAKRLYNSVMARGDRVIANSAYTAQLIQGRYGTTNDRLRVIHRGVDLQLFDPAGIGAERQRVLAEAWGIGPGQRVILQAARLTSWKGQRVLIEAAAVLAKARRLGDAVLVLAGDDQGRTAYTAELRQRADALGLGDRVRMPGHVADIAAALAVAHVAVVASTEPEAFGRSAAEAQAMGCPVIATNIGAPAETVIAAGSDGPGEAATGWLVPPGDPEALAGALGTALELAPEVRMVLGARARRHVAARFTVEAMQHATLSVYDEVLGTSLAGSAAKVERAGSTNITAAATRYS
jgi:glycosyltransferase involved in cell wall biosynthesis